MRPWPALAAAALVVAAGGAIDLSRPPSEQLAARALLTGIRVYRATAARPLAALGVRCRFQPSCSRYAEAVILRHGAAAGLARASWRLLRCGPWTAAATADPP
jgi:hypothetical protein